MSDPLAEGNQPNQTTLDSSEGVASGLRGPVGLEDYRNLDRLAHILGLSDRDDVKAWMSSQVFRVAFDKLLQDWIEPEAEKTKALNTIRRRAPVFRMVVQYIEIAELSGTSRYNLIGGADISVYDEVDHYALCLTSLRLLNTTCNTGIFWGKTLTQEEMDQRLWQAILRGSSDAAKARKKIATQSADEKRDDTESSKLADKSV